MKATLKLLNNYFWKTLYGPILAFIFPTMLLSILGNIMRIEYVFPGVLAITSLFIAVQAMPLGLMEMKNSTLFKYIGASPVDSRKFTFSVILYYLTINFFALIFLMIIGSLVFFGNTFKSGGLYSGIFTGMGIMSFIFSNIIHIFFSLSIGIAIATFSKTPQQCLTIALIIIIPSMFLSGMVLSVDIIAQSKTMQWISRFIPFRYTTGNIVIATTPLSQIGDIMDLIELKNKRLIFNIVGEITKNGTVAHFYDGARPGLLINADGHTFWQTTQLHFTSIGNSINDFTFNTKPTVNDAFAINIYDMRRYYFDHPEFWSKAKNLWFNSNDSTLFRSIFLNKDSLTGSDNNMFKWYGTFGVRRIPDVEEIRKFITVFFKGESKDDPTRFTFIWDKFIKQGDFSFINLFMKQQVILYNTAERVLNFIIPTLSSITLLWYSLKHFAWSSR